MTLHARELAGEEGVVLPRTAFAFFMHQAYECLYFLLDEGDDPQVYLLGEGEGIRPTRMSFATWFLSAADEEIALAELLGE